MNVIYGERYVALCLVTLCFKTCMGFQLLAIKATQNLESHQIMRLERVNTAYSHKLKGGFL